MNKKIFTSFMCLCVIMAGGICFGKETEYKTAPSFVRVTTNMLGYNVLVKKIAQSVLKRSLKKSMTGDYKVKFDSFSGVDLKKGKFKGLTIDGENLCADGELYISKLHLNTTSDFNYVDYSKDPIVFKTDLPMAYSMEMSESDLNKTMSNARAIDTISKLMPLVSIKKPTIKLDNEKIKINSALKFPLGKNLKFSITSGLKVENGKIVMTNVETSGAKHEFVEQFVNLINKQSLLENINMDLFDGAESSATVEKVQIKNNKLYINGKIVIKKAS